MTKRIAVELRKRAVENGLVRYFTGLPCKHGHICDRYTKTSLCCECARLKSNKKYYKDIYLSRQKGRIAAQKRIKKDPQAARDYANLQYIKHRERKKQQAREYKLNNPEKVKETNKKHRENNREKRREAVRLAYLKNPKLWSFHSKLRKSLIKSRIPLWADLEKIKQIYINCPPEHHVDHIYPLRGKIVSGLHVHNNLQYLPAVDNLRKRNKMPDEMAA